MKIHLSAIVHPDAEIPNDVEIGPYCIIGEKVRIGSRTRLISHVVIEGPTQIGEDNVFFPFSSIGAAPQDLKYRGEESRLEIGRRNRIREFVTLNRGTEGGGMVTRIGDDNLLMAYVHVAHDCLVGSGTILGNATTLAGHVLIEDGANVGAFSGVHQFCRVGVHAFIGGYSVITQDALPYIKTVGRRGDARTFGINTLGLQRKAFDESRIAALRQAYKTLFQSSLPTADAVTRIREAGSPTPEVETLLQFMATAERGFVR